jgi:hypothetical protein
MILTHECVKEDFASLMPTDLCSGYADIVDNAHKNALNVDSSCILETEGCLCKEVMCGGRCG